MDLVGQFRDHRINGQQLAQTFIAQSADPSHFAIKWDGEWQITYETFRDMGIAYAAGVVLICLLVVAQFRSYLVPLVIMAPIPLTVIGVMPGHALLGAQVTATSMIGMIALAGICNPKQASEVLHMDMAINMALPCRISRSTRTAARLTSA